jgi:hypothetical protein
MGCSEPMYSGELALTGCTGMKRTAFSHEYRKDSDAYIETTARLAVRN